MVMWLHENLAEMFRDRPGFATELLTGPLGIPVYLLMTSAPHQFKSDFARHYLDEDERRADAVPMFSTPVASS